MILEFIRLVGRSFRDAERANELVVSGGLRGDVETALARFETCPYKSCRELHRRAIPTAWSFRGARAA